MSRPAILAACLAICLTAILAYPDNKPNDEPGDELWQRIRDNLAGESGASCAYTFTESTRILSPQFAAENTFKTVRYRPTEPHWTLLMVNGRAPTEEELKEFKPDDFDHDHPAMLGAEDEEGAQGDDFFGTATQPTLISIDNGQAVYAIGPIEEDGITLQGTLTVDVESAMPIGFEMHNTKARSPNLLVRVKEIRANGEFAHDDQVGGVVQKRMEMYVLARAMMMKFEAQFDIEFGDFNCT